MTGRGGGNVPDSLSARTNTSTIRDGTIGLSTEKADEIVIKGTINFIKHDLEPYYTACATEGCNKKVSIR